MLTRASSSSKPTKFNRPEQEVLVKLNQRLKLAEVTDKKAEILGAINRIGYSAEKMATFCNKLNEVIDLLPAQTARFSIKIFKKGPVLTKELAIELRDQITKAFPITAFSLKLPAPGDVLDIMLESYVTGAYRHRFYQVDAVDKFLEDITAVQKEVLRALVTGLRGMGNLRNVKTRVKPADDDPFKDLSITNIVGLLQSTQRMSASTSASATQTSSEDLLKVLKGLEKFEAVGIRAYKLLSENRLCYDGVESNFRDWGAASANETGPVRRIIAKLEADLANKDKTEQVLDFIRSLNQVIVESVQLAVEFEALRHAEVGVPLEEAENALTKELYREPSALYADSKIAAAEAFYKSDKERKAETKAEEQADSKGQKASDSALGAADGTGKKEEKAGARPKLFTGASGAFSKSTQQSLKFKSREKLTEEEPVTDIHAPEVPAKTEVQANKLPLGFAYQNNEYVYQGDAQSPRSLEALAELSVDINTSIKSFMEWKFSLHSDGMYRMQGNPYYMLIGEHIYAADLSRELTKTGENEITADDGTTSKQSIYGVVDVKAGTTIQLAENIEVTTPVKIVPDATEPSTRLVVQGKEEETSSSDQASSSKSE